MISLVPSSFIRRGRGVGLQSQPYGNHDHSIHPLGYSLYASTIPDSLGILVCYYVFIRLVQEQEGSSTVTHREDLARPRKAVLPRKLSGEPHLLRRHS